MINGLCNILVCPLPPPVGFCLYAPSSGVLPLCWHAMISMHLHHAWWTPYMKEQPWYFNLSYPKCLHMKIKACDPSLFGRELCKYGSFNLRIVKSNISFSRPLQCSKKNILLLPSRAKDHALSASATQESVSYKVNSPHISYSIWK